MADSFLQLNQDKTEIIIFVPEKCTSGIKETLIPLSAAARLLTKKQHNVTQMGLQSSCSYTGLRFISEWNLRLFY